MSNKRKAAPPWRTFAWGVLLSVGLYLLLLVLLTLDYRLLRILKTNRMRKTCTDINWITSERFRIRYLKRLRLLSTIKYFLFWNITLVLKQKKQLLLMKSRILE